MLGTKVLSHQDPSASLPAVRVSLHFPSLSQGTQTHVPNLTHMNLCVSSGLSSHLCGESLAPSPPGSPTPHFPCQERSNYTEISTEKDRLLLWHQDRGSCKSGAATRAASGHCAGWRGALTSTPHFVPSLSSCLGLHPGPGNQSSIWYLSQWDRGRPGTGRGGWGYCQSKMTHNWCSINVP